MAKRRLRPSKKVPVLAVFTIGVILVLLLEKNGTQQSSQQHARLFERSSESKSDTTRSTFAAASTVDATNATSASTHENWRGAPIGDGEDTIDSYHSYDHRPPPHLSGSNHDNDPRDTVLLNYTIYPCPNRGVGREGKVLGRLAQGQE